jgi:signal transduction histidine kinase
MHAASSLDTDDDLDEIVSGIAHDYGNILSVITNYLSLARRRIDDPATVELLEHAGTAAQRAARLTRQLHELGDCAQLQLEVVPVDDLVRGARTLLEGALCSACTLEVDLGEPPLLARGNRTGLEIVLRHLVQNACDAMPDGGVVTITARRPTDRAPRDVVELSVSDTGSGMSAELAERAAEPRFSTRPKGQAAGLGLTIVDRVARRMGGELAIESSEGSGTTVGVVLTAVATDG